MILFRPLNLADKNDLLFLYKCLEVRMTEPDTNISHKSMPTYVEHCKFVQKRPYLEYNLIVNERNTRMGYIYVTKSFEVGVFLMPEYRGEGYGKEALQNMIEKYGNKLLANIGPQNKHSRLVFESLGFEKIQETFQYGK